MNTIEIQGKEFTEGDILQLLEHNGELNARIIAMHAKLENEEKKVQKLQQQLLFISQAFTNKTYEA